MHERGLQVPGQVVDVGDGAAHLRLPEVDVGVHHAGGHDAAGRVDDDRAGVRQVPADVDDAFPADQHGAGIDGPQRGVHRHDGAAAQQDEPVGVGGGAGQCVEGGGGAHRASFRCMV